MGIYSHWCFNLCHKRFSLYYNSVLVVMLGYMFVLNGSSNSVAKSILPVVRSP